MKVYRAVGRRKDAVAQVRLVSPGSGKVSINDRELHDYLPVEVWRNKRDPSNGSNKNQRQF